MSTPQSSTQVIAVFRDGLCWLIYDSEQSRAQNATLAAALAAEGRRRLKTGQSDLFVIKERTTDHVNVIGDTRCDHSVKQQSA